MNTQQILQKLISIQSFSGHEEQIQAYIFNYIKDLGLSPLWIGKNVVVKILGINSEKAIILNAHVDTVGVGNEQLWAHPPFSGECKNNKIYGLGASDEKAAVATILDLLKTFLDQKPACDVWACFVVNEEVDGSGTKLFAQWFGEKHLEKYKKVAAILGEPTGLNKIEIGHKGNIFIKVSTFGDSGHGSQPERIKINAIKLMYAIIGKLADENNKWKNKFENKFLGTPTISLTSIASGNMSSPNKFADTCVATFDIRTTPEVHKKAFLLIKKLVRKIDAASRVEYLYSPAPFGYSNQGSSIVKIAQELTKAEITASPSSNDMCFFTKFKVPAIVFGPGEPSCMHKPDEYCEVSKISQCIEIYAKIITNFTQSS